MPTRNVVLTEHQHELVDALVDSGRYQNASEVLREGLRLVEQRELSDTARLAALRDAAQVGWDDLAEGRYLEVTSEADKRALWEAIRREVDAKRLKAR